MVSPIQPKVVNQSCVLKGFKGKKLNVTQANKIISNCSKEKTTQEKIPRLIDVKGITIVIEKDIAGELFVHSAFPTERAPSFGYKGIYDTKKINKLRREFYKKNRLGNRIDKAERLGKFKTVKELVDKVKSL